MRAPKKYQQGKRVRFELPDVEWLEYHYWELGKSAHVISDEVGTTWSTVLRWMRYLDVEERTRTEIHERHSELMRGTGNPSWAGGSRRSHKTALRQTGTPERCVWCGAGWEGKYSLHLHHKDHNKGNGDPKNLCWLCGHCHRLETALWALLKRDKIDLKCKDRTMVIKFNKENTMSYETQFTEVHDVLATLKPTAANAAVGGHNSGYVSLADYHRAFAWLGVGEPAQGATLDVAITQATSAAGAGAMALLTVGAATKNPATIVAADIGSHVGIEVRSEELDVTNGYVFINVEVDVGVDTFYYELVIFGIVGRYEPVGVTDFLYLMP